MPGALDQAGATVEESIRLPFKANAAMRTAIAIQIHHALAPHGQHGQVADLEAAAGTFKQFFAATKEVHGILPGKGEAHGRKYSPGFQRGEPHT